MDRRQFLFTFLSSASGLLVASLSGCGKEKTEEAAQRLLGVVETLPQRKEITLYDTNAMALYFDGGLGPKTGVIKVQYVIDNQPVKLKFWHGHGGIDHQFTVTPDDFKTLKKLKRATVTTDIVEDHSHKLFIDPVDPRYRVAGAKPVVVIVEDH